MLVRVVWRLLDQGGVIVHEIRNSSRQENYIRGGFGALEDGGEDCLTDEAGFFALQIITLVGGKEASYMGVQFRICMVSLLMRVSRGETSLGVRIRAHTQAALQAQLEAQQAQAQERADMWWSSILRTRFEDGAVEIVWDGFVRLFRAKFVPEHI
ncbi:hypothetical protein Taro_033275 [Colocasia esculenta]|uniref:Uncharacterized protein n=1 Tax=Colocasia esculenta TaxID=4460 RepID=A0A843W8K5_COLES|nr:hypothetical protein [Colocasia esculenta]